jgi:hypothetical protein
MQNLDAVIEYVEGSFFGELVRTPPPTAAHRPDLGDTN